jgi:hypothetical protein
MKLTNRIALYQDVKYIDSEGRLSAHLSSIYVKEKYVQVFFLYTQLQHVRFSDVQKQYFF